MMAGHEHANDDVCDPKWCAGHPDNMKPTPDWYDKVREIMSESGFNISTITLSGDKVDLREDPGAKKSLGYDISDGGQSVFAKRVLGILQGATDVYHDRNAVYKDNFRSVGQVMVALFPEGRPPLVDAADYDRWHIFELIIVKLTRYANNYDTPHEDSLLDMLPYLGILGGLDQELRERFEAERKKVESERLTYEEAVGRRGRRTRGHYEADGPNYEADADKE